MATTKDYLTQLQTDKENLVNNLVEKGVEASNDETFTSLVPKVLDIQSGGGAGMYTPEYLSILRFSNYPGTSLENAVKNIDTSNLISCYQMFYNCPYITTLDISNLKLTNKITTMYQMFASSSSTNTSLKEIIGFEKADVSNVETIYGLFSSLTKLEKVKLPDFSNSPLNSMEQAFSALSNISQDNKLVWEFTEANSIKLTTLKNAFAGSRVNVKNIENISPSKLTTLYYTFSNYRGNFYDDNDEIITTLELKNKSFSALTTMEGIFRKTETYAPQLPLENLIIDTCSFPKLKTMSYICCPQGAAYSTKGFSDVKITNCTFGGTSYGITFYQAFMRTSLKKITIDSSNTNLYVSSLYQMCYGADILTEADLSGIRTNTNANIAGLFIGCRNLQKIDMRNFDFTKITTASNYESILSSVPTNCEIIVMNDACKTWFATNFSTYTNVKTVAELEA